MDWYLAALESARHEQQLAVSVFDRYGYEARPRANLVLHRVRHWAGLPGQTTDRIKRAMQELDGIVDRPPLALMNIEADYCWNLRCLAGDHDAIERRLRWVPEQQWAFRAYFTVFPWERERARRLIRAHARCRLDQLAWLERRIEEDQSVNGLFISEDRLFKHRCWTETTPMVWSLVRGDEWRQRARVGRLVGNHTDRRATKTVLALEAWRLDHGHLPASLDDLVPEFLDRVPVDPVTGRPFEYHPSGIATEITWDDDAISWGCLMRLPPGRPFLSGQPLMTEARNQVRTIVHLFSVYPLSVSE